MLNIRYLVHSEAGESHANEDIVSVRPHPRAENVLLCCLADGQGGQAGGAHAAQVAVEEGLRVMSSFSASDLLQATPWYSVVSAADEAVSEDDAAGFYTLICLSVSEQEIWGASCGDSGVLLLNGGQALLLTEHQRKNPPVGSSAAYPVAFNAKLKPGWCLLVVSDGVWKYVGWEAVTQTAARRQGLELIAALRQAALDANGGKMQDDFSVALLYEED